MLLIIKVLGTALAGIFGMLGIFSDFRDEKGTVTPRGKTAIVGLSASILLTAAAEIWDGVNTRRDTLEATQRIERAIGEIDRSLRRLETMRIFIADFALPIAHPDVAPFFQSIQSSLEPEIELFRTGEATLDAPGAAQRLRNHIRSFGDVPISVRVPDALMPSDPRSVLSAFISVSAVHLQVYESDRQKTDILSGSVTPDLSVTLYASDRSYDDSLELYYELDEETGARESAKLALSGHLTGGGPDDWESNGNIISIPDLRGAWVRMAFSPTGLSDPDKDVLFQELRPLMTIEAMNFQANSRDIWLDANHIEGHTDARGSAVWLFQLGAEDPFTLGP